MFIYEQDCTYTDNLIFFNKTPGIKRNKKRQKKTQRIASLKNQGEKNNFNLCGL